jgi:L-amino acid N-acyltransferase YncA
LVTVQPFHSHLPPLRHAPSTPLPTIEELLALDLLTLREHTERAGAQMDPAAHAAALRESLAFSQTYSIRRNGALVAYAMLNPVSGASWFVRAFNIHPEHRNAAVIKGLLQQVAEAAQREGIAELRSHVYKTNRLSMAFHRKLGFRITKENDRVVEFYATAGELAGNRSVERVVRAI